MILVVRDESKDEREEGNNDEEGEDGVLNLEEERIFTAISKIEKRPKIEVPKFSRNLNLKELTN